MKKKLSLVLAVAMMLTLVPMSAFAGTDNSVNRVVKVKDDAELDTTSKAPVLKIKNDSNDLGTDETFVLRLENAEWLEDFDYSGSKDVKIETVLESEVKINGTVATHVYADRTKSKLEVQVVDLNMDNTDAVLEIPLFVELTGSGVAKVHVETKSGTASTEWVLFANAASGATTITVDDTNDFSNKGDIESIEIEESAIGAIDISEIKDGYIKLKLTKDYEFDFSGTPEVSSDLFSVKKTYAIDPTDITMFDLNKDKDELKILVQGTKGGHSEGIQLKELPGQVGSLEIRGLKAKVGKDAKEGDVKLTVSSNIDEIKSTTLEIGSYAEYKIDVKADGDVKEIFSGRYPEADKVAEIITNDSDFELQTLIIEEKVEGSWDLDKTVSVEFPSWVKILNYDLDADAATAKSYIQPTSIDVDENEFEFEFKANPTDGTKKAEITFYVSVEAGHEGDIEAKVSGRALDKEEFTAVLGKAIAPVKVEAEIAKLKAGVRDQEIGKITITETDEECIKEGEIRIELDKDLEWDDEPTVKVVKGDLEINEDDVTIEGDDDNILVITVDKESSEPSVIEITDARVKVDRAVSEGKIEVEVNGSAVMENGYVENFKFKDETEKYSKTEQTEDLARFSNEYLAKVEVANVITPADQNTQGTEAAKFVIGNAEFMVGEKVMTADVAPYIKDGRTMLSLSFAAQAMGVDSKNIMWDGTTRTVTIFKGDRIAQVQIGSTKMMVNGTPVMMDTVAEIKDGRTMLPVSYVAKALGADVAWDGEIGRAHV